MTLFTPRVPNPNSIVRIESPQLQPGAFQNPPPTYRVFDAVLDLIAVVSYAHIFGIDEQIKNWVKK